MRNEVLKALLFTPGPRGLWGPPFLLESPPGRAKSSIVELVSASCGLACEVFIGSIHEPADLLGLQIPADGVTRHYPPAWIHRLCKDGGVFFGDEFNTCPTSVQNAMLRVALERVVGHLRLPPTVRVVCAQNPVANTAGGTDLSAALANRFVHLPWDGPTEREWSRHTMSLDDDSVSDLVIADLDPRAEEDRVRSIWFEFSSKARGEVTGFIRSKPELLEVEPKEGDPQSSKAWPSLRTWELAWRCLAGARLHGLTLEERDMLVRGCVGEGATLELVEWMSKADIPDAADVLDRKVRFVPDPRRLDLTVAVYNSCAAYVASPRCESRADRACALWEMLGKLEELDVGVPAAMTLVNARIAGCTKVSAPVLAEMNPLLQASGWDGNTQVML